jgi:hypothetical protein
MGVTVLVHAARQVANETIQQEHASFGCVLSVRS